MRPWFALVALVLAACSIEEDHDHEATSPRLLEYAFAYDITSNPGFQPKPDTWNGDTLTHYDYWRLIDQPQFQAEAIMEDKVFQVKYEATSDLVLDWAPTVETRLKMVLPPELDSLSINFHSVGQAAPPKRDIDPAIIRDATVDLLLVLRRK